MKKRSCFYWAKIESPADRSKIYAVKDQMLRSWRCSHGVSLKRINQISQVREKWLVCFKDFQVSDIVLADAVSLEKISINYRCAPWSPSKNGNNQIESLLHGASSNKIKLICRSLLRRRTILLQYVEKKHIFSRFSEDCNNADVLPIWLDSKKRNLQWRYRKMRLLGRALYSPVSSWDVQLTHKRTAHLRYYYVVVCKEISWKQTCASEKKMWSYLKQSRRNMTRFWLCGQAICSDSAFLWMGWVHKHKLTSFLSVSHPLG